MEKEKTFSEQEALMLIEQTILKARQKFKDDGFSLIMWGWIVIVGNIINYIALSQEMPILFLYWAIVCPIGGIISGIKGAKTNKKEKGSSPVAIQMKYIWWGCAITAVLLWLAAASFGWTYINAAMFVSFGAPVFITGGIMKFKPSIFGGLILFVFGIVSFYIASYDWSNLVAALGWSLGYLVPGYLLKREAKKQ